MTILKQVAGSVQQAAEAIALAIGVEVKIVDNELTIVGGTGYYLNKLGLKEELGQANGNVDETSELAEVCTPIKSGEAILGIIGLVALTGMQKAILLDKKRSKISFVEKMAEILAEKAIQCRILKETETSMNEIATILETAHEGILAIDNKGYINHCNHVSELLFRTTKEDLEKSHISKFMLGTPALNVLKTGSGYTENEEIYSNERGNFHFIVSVKPFITESTVSGAVISLRDIEEAQKLVYNINNRTLKYTFDDIMGESDAMRRAKNQALLTARGNSTVLITGESGTGKEMFAKAIHYSSSRSKGPFVTVNCGAIPENLLESELFGYEKGAFTGANEKGKVGKFELANGGTIFLDEIGDMPIHLQVKILHVLQNMRFERVGGNKTIIVDVRVIAATNRDLESMIKEGSFREDLYYRLSVIPLSIPPLRERKADIKLLMYHFLKKYNTFMNKKITGFTDEAEAVYSNYEWPGNVRELENAVEYGVNMAFGNKIGEDAIPVRLFRQESHSFEITDSDLPLNDQIRMYEKKIISRKLKEYGNTQNAKEKIAKDLGLSRATLYRKLAELEL